VSVLTGFGMTWILAKESTYQLNLLQL
jgi:hypothetical protein